MLIAYALIADCLNTVVAPQQGYHGVRVAAINGSAKLVQVRNCTRRVVFSLFLRLYTLFLRIFVLVWYVCFFLFPLCNEKRGSVTTEVCRCRQFTAVFI